MTASRTVVRIPENLYVAVREDIAAWAERGLETFLFLVLTRVETVGRTLYLARSVVRLGPEEAVRQASRTRPTERFARDFYEALLAAGVFSDSVRIAAVHSHPFSRGHVAFSGIDHNSFAADADVFAESLGGVEFVALVLDRDASAYDGLIVKAGSSAVITEVQVVGRTFTQLHGPGGGAR